MPQEIELNYWIVGTDPSEILSVKIGTGDETAKILKDKIKEENGLFTGEIDIWKVSPAVELSETDKFLSFPLDLKKRASKRINLLFPDQPPHDHLHLIVRSQSLTLKCYLQDEDIIVIEIPRTLTVFQLKKAIKAEKSIALQHVDADMISLWKFCGRKDNGFEREVEDLKDDDRLTNDVELWKVFPYPHELDPEHLHIVVRLPDTATAVTEHSIFALNCHVPGERADQIFSVNLAPTDTVKDLKLAVKTNLAVDAAPIRLWRTSIPLDSNFQESIRYFDFDKEKPLQSAMALSAAFPRRLRVNHVHVIIIREDGLLPLKMERERVFKRKTGAPSTEAEPATFEKIQQDPVGYYPCCRPPHREPFLSLTLLDHIFAKFVDESQTVTPTGDAYECAKNLRFEMNKFYGNEGSRADTLREVFRAARIVDIRDKSVEGTQYLTDGHILCKSNPIIILELKNEIGAKAAEPSLQALLYYRHFMGTELWKDVSSIHPSFVVTLVGPRIAFAGCVLTDRPTLETFSSVMLDFHKSNSDAFTVLARHLTALKNGLDALYDRYMNPAAKSLPGSANTQGSRRIMTRSQTASLKSQNPDGKPATASAQGSQGVTSNKTVPHDPPPYSIYRVFPYQATFFLGENKPVKFVYDTVLQERSLLFKGHTSDRRDICVKFVRRYGKDVHMWCAEQGFAPKLLAFETLPGGWFMVVMEFLDESWEHLSDDVVYGDGLKESIHAAIVKLHQHGMVHGDIRESNIMVKGEGPEFMLLDYDWSGLANQVRYPEFINLDADLGRPSDVAYNVPIIPRHDIDMLENIFY